MINQASNAAPSNYRQGTNILDTNQNISLAESLIKKSRGNNERLLVIREQADMLRNKVLGPGPAENPVRTPQVTPSGLLNILSYENELMGEIIQEISAILVDLNCKI